LFPYMGGIVRELKGTALIDTGWDAARATCGRKIPTARAVRYSLSPFGLGVRRQNPKMFKLQGQAVSPVLRYWSRLFLLRRLSRYTTNRAQAAINRIT